MGGRRTQGKRQGITVKGTRGPMKVKKGTWAWAWDNVQGKWEQGQGT